jgi:hypothetical protein
MNLQEQLAKAVSAAMVADLQANKELRDTIDNVIDQTSSLQEAKQVMQEFLLADIQRGLAGGAVFFPQTQKLLRSQATITQPSAAMGAEGEKKSGNGDFDWGALIGGVVSAIGGVVVARYKAKSQEKILELQAKAEAAAAAKQEEAARAAEQAAAEAERALLLETQGISPVDVPAGQQTNIPALYRGAVPEKSFFEKYGLYIGLGVAGLGLGIFLLSRKKS